MTAAASPARTAWIESFRNRLGHTVYRYVVESAVRKGRRDATLNSWADRRGAYDAAKRAGFTVASGDCPLPCHSKTTRALFGC